MKGIDVYRKLMDLDLILQDEYQMASLRIFLDSIQKDHPSLIKLDAEIEAFKKRIEQLVAVSVSK
jgi:hypothetical protein